ncbi:tetratricopeptide repeat protein [Mariniblastus fucicola]|uniref:Tetratricopeptide repeat protein n=1 Tax=Mariniblastus fucicola TaxID=980251 RepID=A0A5B9PBJ1_9BACT|nr:tetratricopeptide repeat protein [Mariniblastus fucicola]QEG22575.1 tetratricopeptide repeat protein [Mariniblastus fucicola]
MNFLSQNPTREELLDQIQRFYDEGQYLKAWALSRSLGPLKHWRGAREMVLAGRLAFNLGSRRLGNVLHRLALRMHPNDPMVVTFAMLTMSGRLGPWGSLQRMKLHGDLPHAKTENRADWMALKALNYAQLRDFQKAEYWQAKAFELAPESAWMYVSQTAILECQDLNDEATRAAEKAYAIKPTYRPAIQSLANRYIESNRDQDAVDLLYRAVNQIESGLVRCQLASFYRELEFYEHALQLYDGIEKYFPLLSEDAKYEQWLAGVHSDLNYLNGKRNKAIEWAQKVDDDFYREFVGRLSDPSFTGRRVQLPVKYVKQHHVTCAPATLSAIAMYWQKGTDHLEVVEKICYDGTPSDSERRWAAKNGFKTVEFTLTWEAATALIDRGLPFTLTTIEPGNGHLQPIIGYDSFRKTLITRDPGNRHASEFLYDKMQKRYESTGPRAMALVPNEYAQQIDGITFPDAKEYDLLFNVELCLEKHQRDKANDIVSLMEQHFPDHRLTLRARISVARYDSDVQTMLSSVDRMLSQFPDDANFQMQKLSCLHQLGRREDRLKSLREIRHSDRCHPLFWTRLAEELVDDAREKNEVDYLLKRATRFRFRDGYGFYLLARTCNDQGRYEEAIELFRIAACLDGMSEHRAQAYFSTAQSMNRMGEALFLLEDRLDRFGSKSSSPAMTLASAYEDMDQTERAFAILDDAANYHSADGEFLLYYSDFCNRYGRTDQAAELLAAAKPHSSKTQWLHHAAQHASRKGESETALSCLLEVVEDDPLNTRALSHTLSLIADREGRKAAISRIRKQVEAFPNSYSLRKLLIEWLASEKSEVRELELNRFLQLHPNDAWALRELASVLAGMKRFDDALKAIKQACAVDPNSPATHGFRGEVYQKQNRLDDAIESYRQALSITIDYQYAIHELINCCSTREQRKQQLRFILAELNRQTSRGDGLLQYRKHAKQVLEPEALLQSLLEFLGKREDLWQSWVALSRQLSDMQRHEEAISIATKVSEKFPLLPRVWLELAATYSACGKWDQQIESLKKANSINCRWGEVIRTLSEAYDKKGELELAKLEIAKAIKLDPRNAINFGYLADLTWRHGDKEQALEKIAHAVRLDPDYEFAWSSLRSWCEQLGKPDFDVTLAKELCRDRPEESRSWLKLAYCLDQPHQVEDAIEALDKAIEIDPLLVAAYSQKASLYCVRGRFDEARGVLQTDAFGENYPVELSVRRAVISAEEGRQTSALHEVLDVVDRDPDYFKAWHCIADWASDLDESELYTRAAENMTRLEPQYYVAWGYLAEACLRNGRRDDAKTHLQQALQLAPDYTYAAGQLLQMQMEDGEFAAARKVVATVTPHVSAEVRLSKLIQIESRCGDQYAAFRYFKELAALETENIESLSESVPFLQKAGWNKEAMDLLSEIVQSPVAMPAVGDAFAFHAAKMERWISIETTLDKIRSQRKLWDVTACRFLQEAQDAGESDRFFSFVASEREFIRASLDGWQNLGWLYVRVNLYEECIRWMFDWGIRPRAESWSLLNLATAFFCTRKDHKAAEICEFALERKECPVAIAANLQVMLGCFRLVYGDLNSAFELMSTIDPDRLPGFYQVVFYQTMAALGANRTENSYSAIKKEMEALIDELDASFESDVPVLMRNHHLILWSVARREGKSIRAALLQRKAYAEMV